MIEEYLNNFDEIFITMTEKLFPKTIENNIMSNFIICTIPHHEASILICENVLNYTQNSDLRKLVYDIIENQRKRIMKLENSIKSNTYSNSPLEIEEYMKEYRKIITTMIFKMYDSPKYQNIDINFLGEITPLFESFILMCENVLKYEMKEDSRNFINEMLEEVKENLKLLNKIVE